ncbi:MAG: STAS domain-containing protein [Candidatus Kerfeldbacteria bacterium]|nr:STAS domain-containing protein [Candidatus Kerfeldbacteria bacterium]
MSRLFITVEARRLALVRPIGTVDRDMVNRLDSRLQPILASGIRNVVLSFKRTSHIHFQALGELIALHERLEAGGCQFRIIGVSPYLEQILAFGGIVGVIPILSSVEEAT